MTINNIFGVCFLQCTTFMCQQTGYSVPSLFMNFTKDECENISNTDIFMSNKEFIKGV